MSKILIISHTFFPYISPRSFRATELAKEFSKQLHDVTVITATGSHNYDSFERDFGIRVLDFGKMRFIKKSNSVRERYNFIDKIFIRLFSKAMYYPNIEFLWKIPWRLRKIETKFDLVITIAAPHSIHWGFARFLSANPGFTVKWIADCGDPFSGNSVYKVPAYLKYLENWAFDKANFITVPHDAAVQGYDIRHIDKVQVIPQGFDFSNVKLKEYKKNIIPTFAYAGNFYKDYRDPTLFLEYLAKVKFDFKFIIYTESTAILKPYINRLGERLIIREYVPREQLLLELSTMDFLVNFENKHSVQVPSKLIDYGIIKRPVLNISSDHLDSETITQFLNSDYTRNVKIDIESYNITNICRQFLSL